MFSPISVTNEALVARSTMSDATVATTVATTVASTRETYRDSVKNELPDHRIDLSKRL